MLVFLAVDWRQGEDSCVKSEAGETPQERMRRGGSVLARGKRSLARKSKSINTC
ncbi:hypothetical protein ABEY43_08930 [Priestia megaterium]|uniref:hypothetical protein n=1 Tax=Priestia megaterium TaxID=1404 RepID=UPI002E1FB703|nr:hypothetical protein [Priestia megaterium]